MKKILLLLLLGILPVSSLWAQDSQEENAVDEETTESTSDVTLDGSGKEAAEAVQNIQQEQESQAQDAVAEEDDAENVKQEAEVKQQEELAKDAPETPQPSSESQESFSGDSISSDSQKITANYSGSRFYGKYKIQLSGTKFTFNEGQKCYDKLYGSPPPHFAMSADWFPGDFAMNPGLMVRFGIFSARGKAAKGKINANCGELEADDNSKTSLLFMPLQIGPKLQFSPFSKKWIVFDLWLAGEYGWWQETRDTEVQASSVKNKKYAADSSIYTNSGSRQALSTGASVHFLLNALDQRTVRSMVNTIGVGYVYLTGYFENVKTINAKGLTFGRNALGLGFTFETSK